MEASALVDKITGPAVKLVVGPNQTEYLVHRALLTSSCAFFKAALTADRWREGHEALIRLSEDDPDAVALLSQWLYSKSVQRSAGQPHEPALYARLFALAHRLDIPGLQNAAMDVIRKQICADIDAAALRAMHALAPPGSQLRRFIASLHAWWLMNAFTPMSDEDVRDTAGFSVELVQDVLVQLRDGQAVKRKEIHDPRKTEYEGDCRFHVHPDGKRCAWEVQAYANRLPPPKRKRVE